MLDFTKIKNIYIQGDNPEKQLEEQDFLKVQVYYYHGHGSFTRIISVDEYFVYDKFQAMRNKLCPDSALMELIQMAEAVGRKAKALEKSDESIKLQNERRDNLISRISNRKNKE